MGTFRYEARESDYTPIHGRRAEAARALANIERRGREGDRAHPRADAEVDLAIADLYGDGADVLFGHLDRARDPSGRPTGETATPEETDGYMNTYRDIYERTMNSPPAWQLARDPRFVKPHPESDDSMPANRLIVSTTTRTSKGPGPKSNAVHAAPPSFNSNPGGDDEGTFPGAQAGELGDLQDAQDAMLVRMKARSADGRRRPGSSRSDGFSGTSAVGESGQRTIAKVNYAPRSRQAERPAPNSFGGNEGDPSGDFGGAGMGPEDEELDDSETLEAQASMVQRLKDRSKNGKRSIPAAP